MTDYKKELEDLVVIVTQEGASDLHLTAGRHPSIRVSGDLIPVVKKPILMPEDTLGLVMSALSDENRELFLKQKDIDFSYSLAGGVRFRGNAFYQKGFVGAAFRLIPLKVKTFAELNLPDRLADFTRLEQGLFWLSDQLVIGKSTTLASMVDMINHDTLNTLLRLKIRLNIFLPAITPLLINAKCGLTLLIFTRR